MIIDLSVLFFAMLYLLCIHKKGFSLSLFNLVIQVVSLGFALKAYPALAGLINFYLGAHSGISRIISFALVFGLTYSAIYIKSENFSKKLLLDSSTNIIIRTASEIFSVIPACIAIALWLLTFFGVASWFPINQNLKNQINSSAFGSLFSYATSSFGSQPDDILASSIENATDFLDKNEKRIVRRINIPSDAKLEFDSAGELFMFNLINSEREKRNLPRLNFDIKLREVARKHSVEMIQKNYFSHKSPTSGFVSNRLFEAKILHLVAGENIAYSIDLELAHDNLMKSHDHKENILNKKFRKIGIGIVYAGAYGYMCTQVFTD